MPTHITPKQSLAKVLIVEDDTALLNILTYKIADSGFDVMQASDGAEGLNLAFKKHPDLIILDLLLPKTPGLEFLDRLRSDEWGKRVPVFVLTNISAYGTIYKSLELQTDAYFIKSDSSLEEIASEVKSRLEQPHTGAR